MRPLRAACGIMVPAMAAAASVVGRPSASSAQASGMGVPAFCASITLPRATWLSERSMRSGSPCAPGRRRRWGSCRRAPAAAQGAIAAGEFDSASAIIPPRERLDSVARTPQVMRPGHGDRREAKLARDRPRASAPASIAAKASRIGIDPKDRPVADDLRFGRGPHLPVRICAA